VPFRDDEDARLARLTSLERENEELREELEAARPADTKPAAATARPVSERSEHASPRQRAGWLRHGPRVLIVAAVIAAVVVSLRCAASLTRTETIVDIAYVDGVLSLQIDRATRRHRHTNHEMRIETVDPASGARLGAVSLGDVTTVKYPAMGTRAWAFLGKRELALVDLRIPAIVVRPSEVAQRVPELAAGFEIGDVDDGLSTVADGAVADHEARTPDAVPVILADGSRLWLTPEPRLVPTAPQAAAPRPVGYACYFYDAPSCEQRRCFTWVSSEGTTTRRLGWREPWDKQSTLAGPEPAVLHAPAFVKRIDRSCALEVDGGVLVRHDSSALEPKHRLLSLVAGDGTLRWSRRVDELGGESAIPAGALLAGDRICVLLGDAWGRESMSLHDFRSKHLVLVHLSAKTGETLAKHALW
jgi:hypothetical protein